MQTKELRYSTFYLLNSLCGYLKLFKAKSVNQWYL